MQGVLQEVLQALPTQGDQCRWGPLQLEVLEAAERGRCRVEVRIIDPRTPEGPK